MLCRLDDAAERLSYRMVHGRASRTLGGRRRGGLRILAHRAESSRVRESAVVVAFEPRACFSQGYGSVADHDHAYKLLFSHPELVRDLLEGFVKEPWLEQLDYGSRDSVPSTYLSDVL